VANVQTSIDIAAPVQDAEREADASLARLKQIGER
jgi:hypothetical protein